MSNKVKAMDLMSNFQQITYREIGEKMVLSVWIAFCELDELTNIMGCSYFCKNAPLATLLEDRIYMEDFIPFLEYLSFSYEEINEICNRYKEA
jgi:hypothetical protein